MNESVSGSGVRRIRRAALALALLVGAGGAAAAQEVKFTLDFRFSGQQSPFLLAAERGYYKPAGSVTVDSSQGSVDAVSRVAGGAYQVGFADINPLIKYNAENPGKELIAVAVMYDASPLAVLALKKTGIAKPKDLEGRKIAGPEADSGRQMFPAFAKANGIDTSRIQWQNVSMGLREQTMVTGASDGMTGFLTSGVFNLRLAGVQDSEIVVLRYRDHGVDVYSTAIFTSPDYAARHPEVVKAIVAGSIKGHRDAIADPAASIAALKRRDPSIREHIELERLQLTISSLILTPHVAKNGVSAVDPARLKRNIDIVADAYGLQSRPAPEKVYTDRFLPPKAELMLR